MPISTSQVSCPRPADRTTPLQRLETSCTAAEFDFNRKLKARDCFGMPGSSGSRSFPTTPQRQSPCSGGSESPPSQENRRGTTSRSAFSFDQNSEKGFYTKSKRLFRERASLHHDYEGFHGHPLLTPGGIKKVCLDFSRLGCSVVW